MARELEKEDKQDQKRSDIYVIYIYVIYTYHVFSRHSPSKSKLYHNSSTTSTNYLRHNYNITNLVEKNQKVRSLNTCVQQNAVHCAFSCMPSTSTNPAPATELRARLRPISTPENSHVISATQLFV